MKLIKKTLENFLLLSLLLLIVPVQADPVPNRNIKWEANSCWVSVGLHAFTGCQEFVEAYQNINFTDNTPEKKLQNLLGVLMTNKIKSKNEYGNIQSAEKPVLITDFKQSLADHKIIERFNAMGTFFVPLFLNYLKHAVNTELAYFYFGITCFESKRYRINAHDLEGTKIFINFSRSIEDFKSDTIATLNRYSLIQIPIDLVIEYPPKTGEFRTVNGFEHTLNRINHKKYKNTLNALLTGNYSKHNNLFKFSLIAKGLDGHSSSSPMGPHTIAIVKKEPNSWFLYNDGVSTVKEIEFDNSDINHNNTAFAYEYKYGNNDTYKTDFVYLQVDELNVKATSIVDCIKYNRFDQLNDPALKKTINDPDLKTSLTALHFGCVKACRKIIEELVNMGADINARTNLGDTPLHFAATTCSAGTIRYLIEQGAQVNTLNKLEESPLFYAIKNENVQAAQELISQGANINQVLQEYSIINQDKTTTIYQKQMHIFNYMLDLINQQNATSFAPLIEKISVSKKLTHVDKVKIQSFLDNNISPRWDHDAAEKVRITLNNILTGPSLPLPTAAEEDRLKEEARLEHERLEKERLEKERLEREKLERERLEREKLERERLERERLERERLERERLERERLERERLERERLERERLEDEKRKKEEKNVLNKKLTQLKDSLTHLKTKLSTLQKQLKSLSKKITR